MARTVYCRKYQKELEGLDRPPYPGVKGEDIFQNISKQAWNEWQSQQTMLINEKRLNMMHSADRQFLQEEMSKFFAGQIHATADGYVPPKI